MLLNDNTEPSGRRLVDIGYFFNEIKNIRHRAFDCTFSNLKFEQEIMHGFRSTFILKCEVCGLKEKYLQKIHKIRKI